MTNQERLWLLQQSEDFKKGYVNRLRRVKRAQRNLAIGCFLVALASAICLALTAIGKL